MKLSHTFLIGAVAVGLSACSGSNLLGGILVDEGRRLKLIIGTATATLTEDFYKGKVGACDPDNLNDPDLPPLIWFDPGDGTLTRGHPCFDPIAYEQRHRERMTRSADKGTQVVALECETFDWWDPTIMSIPAAPDAFVTREGDGGKTLDQQKQEYCAAHFEIKWPAPVHLMTEAEYVSRCEQIRAMDKMVRTNIGYRMTCEDGYLRSKEVSKKKAKPANVYHCIFTGTRADGSPVGPIRSPAYAGTSAWGSNCPGFFDKQMAKLATHSSCDGGAVYAEVGSLNDAARTAVPPTSP